MLRQVGEVNYEVVPDGDYQPSRRQPHPEVVHAVELNVHACTSPQSTGWAIWYALYSGHPSNDEIQSVTCLKNVICGETMSRAIHLLVALEQMAVWSRTIFLRLIIR